MGQMDHTKIISDVHVDSYVFVSVNKRDLSWRYPNYVLQIK